MLRHDEDTPAILRRVAPSAVFVVVLFVALWLRTPPTEAPPELVELRGEAFGTTFVVKVGGDVDAAAVQAATQAQLAEVDRLMSTWRDDSELSRFNAAAAGPFVISESTAAVVRLAGQVHAATGGAFDVTVGPLVRAWGFGPDGPTGAPTDEELAALRALVGFDRVRLDGTTLSKAADGVQVDLSAIAKGYGVDRVAEAVAALDGATGVMVEIGGEVRVIGPRAEGRPWRLAVERPDAERRVIHSVVAMDGGALATSGDYRRFIDGEGDRRTHVLDPATGRPVDHGVASASVLAPDCATADAWATALMVMAPDAGLAAVGGIDGLDAMVMVRTDDGLAVRMTPGFESALQTPGS